MEKVISKHMIDIGLKLVHSLLGPSTALGNSDILFARSQYHQIRQRCLPGEDDLKILKATLKIGLIQFKINFLSNVDLLIMSAGTVP